MEIEEDSPRISLSLHQQLNTSSEYKSSYSTDHGFETRTKPWSADYKQARTLT